MFLPIAPPKFTPLIPPPLILTILTFPIKWTLFPVLNFDQGKPKAFRTFKAFFIEHLWWLLLNLWQTLFQSVSANIYPLNINNKNTRKRCQVCSKLTIKKRHKNDVPMFESVLNKVYEKETPTHLFKCFHCWLSTIKCLLSHSRLIAISIFPFFNFFLVFQFYKNFRKLQWHILSKCTFSLIEKRGPHRSFLNSSNRIY